MSLKKALACLALVLLFAVLSGAPACVVVTGQNARTGSGDIVTWDFDYADFSSIEVSSAFDVTIDRADSYLVRITIDKALYEYLQIDQRGDTLRISLKSGYSYVNTSQQAVINLPDLRRLKLSGASQAALSGFSFSHSLDFELHDASQLTLENTIAGNCGFSLHDASQVEGVIEMDDGSFNLSDASFLELQGSADDISIDASDASRADLADFAVLTADVHLSGASGAVVNVSERMDVSLSSASSLEYIGSPKLGKLEMSGASTLNQAP
jgi:hypothetical protein